MKYKWEFISPNISQTGGKYRLRKRLQKYTPIHFYFLSLFAGAMWFELCKPRTKYECFNDKDHNYINYFETIREFHKQFDLLKNGVLGLVSQKLFNKIATGHIFPQSKVEIAYYFYYIKKLGFAGTGNYYLEDVKDNMMFYAISQLVELISLNVRQFRVFQEIDKSYNKYVRRIRKILRRSQKELVEILTEIPYNENTKQNYRGITLPTVSKREYIKQSKEDYKRMKTSSYMGLNPKTTRPFTNNDNGLTTPVDPQLIKRLRYVNLACYDFRKAYKSFYNAYYKKKGLGEECFVFCDPPYPERESYYGHFPFERRDHYDLIKLLLDSPFRVLLTIGGKCEFYLEAFKDWYIIEEKVKYSTSANNQIGKTEYLIMNYDYKEVPMMRFNNKRDQSKITSFA